MAAPKKGLLAIIAGGKPSGGDDEDAGGAVQTALKDMFSAMKSGDWSGAESAFRDAKAACDDEYEDDAAEEL